MTGPGEALSTGERFPLLRVAVTVLGLVLHGRSGVERSIMHSAPEPSRHHFGCSVGL
jgi:hypothetical protein